MTPEMTPGMTTQQKAPRLVPRSAPPAGRLRDRVLARVLAARLDRELAAGCPAGFSRAMAARAWRIVSPAGRRELARGWELVLAQASRPPVPRSPRGMLRRGVVAGAERDVRELLAALTGGRPVTVRGAAMAGLLLRDGTGPLYNQRCARDLGTAVREATRQLAS
ncbi:MAG: hypothetical protein ACLPN6_14260 [Streptosporangiaceae bacterium]